jgi:CAAX protease family protein
MHRAVEEIEMTPASKGEGYRVLVFFLLAYALSWWPSLVEAHSILPAGPLLAALCVLAWSAGRSGMRDFLGRILRWRVAPRWYLFVLGLPPALTAVVIGLTVLGGASAPSWERVPPLSDLPLTFVFIFLLIGLGEEPAWRGYALPRLARGRSVLAASFLLGALHVLWHLPLFGLEYDLQSGPPWLVSVLAYTVLTSWLYYHTDGNLLLPALFHTSVNVTAKYAFLPLFQGGDTTRLWWIWSGLWWVVAISFLARSGRELGRGPVDESSGKSDSA